MSLHFSANQFEKAYHPNRLGNWEAFKHSKSKRPCLRQGKTIPISDVHGHLLQSSKTDLQASEPRQVTSNMANLAIDPCPSQKIRRGTTRIGQSAPQKKTALLVITGSALHSTRSLKKRHVKIEPSKTEDDFKPTMRLQNFMHDRTTANNELDPSFEECPSEEQVVVPLVWPRDLPPTPRKAAIFLAQRQKMHRPLPDVDEDRRQFGNNPVTIPQPRLVALNSTKAKGPTACTKRRVWKPKAFKPITATSEVVLGSQSYEPSHNMELAIQWEIPLSNENGPDPSKGKKNAHLYQSSIVFSDYGTKTNYKPAIKTRKNNYVPNSLLTEPKLNETPRLNLDLYYKSETPVNMTHRVASSTLRSPVLANTKPTVRYSIVEQVSSQPLSLQSTQRSQNYSRLNQPIHEQVAFESIQKTVPAGPITTQRSGTPQHDNKDSDSESGYQEGSSDEEETKLKTPRNAHKGNSATKHDHFVLKSLPEHTAPNFPYLPEYPLQKRSPSFVARKNCPVIQEELDEEIMRSRKNKVLTEYPAQDVSDDLTERPTATINWKAEKTEPDSGMGSQEDLQLQDTVLRAIPKCNKQSKQSRSRPCLACDWSAACTSTAIPNTAIPPHLVNHAPLCPSQHVGPAFKAGRAQEMRLTEPQLIADRRKNFKIPRLHILNTQARHVKNTLTPPFAVWPGSRGQEFPDIHRLESTYDITFGPRKNKKSITALLNQKTCKIWK